MNDSKSIHNVVTLFVLFMFLVLTQFNCNIEKTPSELGYEKSQKILNRLEETEILERCFFMEYNKRSLGYFHPNVRETLEYAYNSFSLEVYYIALVDSGELLIKSKDISFIAKDAENILCARQEDMTRDDTVFIKSDTIDLQILH